MTEPLEGVDAVDWAALDHAYGPADDVPDMLRATLSADADEREAACDDLFSSLCHQGDVYGATAAAVPFVARLAEAGGEGLVRRLWLLAAAADGHGPEREAVGRAVAGALPPLLRLAADDDSAVREAMVQLVTATGPRAVPLLPLLRARLDGERDPELRAHLVTALGLLDVSDTARTARNTALLSAPEPPVRRAAVTDVLRTAEPPFPDELVDAAAAVFAAADDEGGVWPRPHVPLAQRLLDDREAARRAVSLGVPIAQRLTDVWRDCEADALPALAAGVGHRYDLLPIARIGPALEPGTADASWLEPYLGAADPGMRVAAALAAVRLRLPGSLERVLALMDELPDYEDADFGTRIATATVVRAAVESWGDAAEPVAAQVAAAPRARWTGVLRAFPELAAGSADALVALLPASARALGAAGPAAGREAARALRSRAERGDLASALALARVAGDASPAVALLRGRLGAEPATDDLAAAGALGAAGAPLVPLIEPVIAPRAERRPGARAAAAGAAAALWRITGRPDTTAPVVAGALGRARGFGEPQVEQVRVLLAMGVLPDPARPAVERLAHSERRVVTHLFPDGEPHIDTEARAVARRLLAVADTGREAGPGSVTTAPEAVAGARSG
ncbi:hypothetical protein [Streptomyces sp. t39]|uniref:hypothetical protein n=1 Tax=Streptomyces sp. t39 TaxID=1828156 RepID=UPI0011CDC50E|nr:hypothetical protein [Streptomyces sp. t39]TXS50815.1 hypothetical protein EAO77_22945 [Streptomyces sp. t39]